MRPYRRRSAFTLIELLVVIAMIAILLALTTGTVFRVMSSQREKNTNVHLQKIDAGFKQQYEEAVKTIKKESPPPALVDRTRNVNPDGTRTLNNDRALAMWMKLRLRQEFPQSFGELTAVTISGGTGSSASNYTLSPKDFYTKALASYTSSGLPEEESAVLLVLSMRMGRGGQTIDPDKIARTKDMGNGIKVFVDEFGTPIAFRRWAEDDFGDAVAELNTPPGDRTDPKGTLQAMPNHADRTYLETPFLPIGFDNKNRGPVVFSAGKNKQFVGSTDDNLYSHRLGQFGGGKP